MDAIINLVNQATHELEKINNMGDMVGNRPHYPMFIASNQSTASVYDQLRRKMELVWPQSSSKLIYSPYKCCGGNEVKLESVTDGEVISETQMRGKLDEVKFSREAFESMGLWCIYNIIDTTSTADIEEFKRAYEAVSYLKELVVDSSRTLLIVVLDDSTAKRALANEIKAFLADNFSGYDGGFIVSNRTQNNELHQMDEIYRIVSNVMILSNNDAVAEYDNEAYSTLVSCFYNGKINTVSYSLLERPNKKIAIQLIDTIIKAVKNKCKSLAEESDQHTWRKRLGVGNRIDVCEECLKKVQLTFDMDSLQYLPMRNGENIKKVDVNKITYAQFKALTFDGVLEQLIENYYRTELFNDPCITSCLEKYEKKLKETVTAPSFAVLKDEVVDGIFAQLEEGDVSTALPLSAYIREQMLGTIRKSILYPKCKELAKSFINSSAKSMRDFKAIQEDFVHSIPLTGFDDIGTVYAAITENYLSTQEGEKDVLGIIAPGNTYAEMVGCIVQTVKNIISRNKADFSLSFVEEWEKRLNIVGDTIYREIYEILDSNPRNKIHLFGNFAIEEKLQVYMLHTSDARGENHTELYNHLYQAYKDVQGAQFFNTGSDDSLEVMKIIDCTGDKLKL